MTNTVRELELLISMFVPDGSGRLLPNKVHKWSRSFDEDNVFSTYNFFIHRLADPDRPGTHEDAYDAVLHTHGKYLLPIVLASMVASDPLLTC